MQDILAELLNVQAWGQVLYTYARTTKVAVALTDPAGRLLGECHNPQEAWKVVQGNFKNRSEERSEICPFCLAPETPCDAVSRALAIGQVSLVHDLAGMAHVAVPLRLGDRAIGAIIAGQVFDRYPDQVALLRAAKAFDVSAQQLWQASTRQIPVRRSTLLIYGELLSVLGSAFLRDRYANILDRQLTQANRRYQQLIDGAEEYGFFSVDFSGNVTNWNSGAERLFDYSGVEILGKSWSILFALEETGVILNHELQRADRDGSARLFGWNVRKDGTRFFAENTFSSQGDEKSREYGILVHDITERRNAEEALRQAQKLESIGILASGIAHDFNNLLTGILGGLSFARSILSPDHVVSPMLQLAQQSSERAAALTHQLLAYAGKGQFLIKQFDLSNQIKGLLPLVSMSIPKRVELRLNLPADLPLIEADPSQIEQVVMNLVINAAEAIGPEGGSIQVSTGLATATSSDEVFVEVADNGSGMDEELKARMFDPFFTTKFLGRGLGLSAVSGIIRAHRGRMIVDSAVGEGTTFRVFFPAVQQSGTVPDVSIVRPQDRHSGTVLLVDDEAVVRTLAETILTSTGYAVKVAENGRQALETFSSNPDSFALVVLDMTMPIMDGGETLQRIREIRPKVPILIASGYSEQTARDACLSVNDSSLAFIHKPYNAEDLILKVQQSLIDAKLESLSAGV